MSLPIYSPEEQQILLEKAAKKLGYESWADYKAAQLDWSDPCWDTPVSEVE